MPCLGAAPAAPAASRAATPMGTLAQRRHWRDRRPLVREEKVQIKEGGGGGLGWAEQRAGPSPRAHAVPSLQQRPVLPPQPPDPSIGARSSHRASLAGALQGPPEPTPRHGRGCGAGLAPGRGTRPPTGGRRRGQAGAPGVDSRRRRKWPGAGRGGRLSPTLA
jgi:hypothetical protein